MAVIIVIYSMSGWLLLVMLRLLVRRLRLLVGWGWRMGSPITTLR